MRKGKSPLKKSKIPKPEKRPLSKSFGGVQQIGLLQMKIIDLEANLQQSQQLNHLYLGQIKDLEEDNLTLCARLQEIKVEKEGALRDYIQQSDKLKSQVDDLLQVVRYLEGSIEGCQAEAMDLRGQLEVFRAQSEAGKLAGLRVGEMAAEVDRGKLKLMESERYWMTRCETRLSQMKADYERASTEKEGEMNRKIRLLGDELMRREREVQQKTGEIYKLIQHIHNLAR